MEFYTSYCEKRPVRLCEATRRFAYESLYEHKYGLATRKNPCVYMDEVCGFSEMGDLDKYDAIIRKIATEAEIRICEKERVSGAATLGDAIDHVIPARYKGEIVFYSVSHLTMGFDRVLKIGFNGIKKEAEAALEKYTGGRPKRFIESCLSCIESLDIWRKRYIERLKAEGRYEDNIAALENVPMNPPKNFKEAVQSLWFSFAFARLCGNWPGIGRIDQMLGGYLKADLDKGEITLDEAREVLAHLFIKGCEWVCGGLYAAGGDGQHYQNIVLAGIDENRNEVTNEVTYLVLDILEELGISDFPTTVRINKNTDIKLINRIAEVMRYGNGILAVYNEDKVLQALEEYGYDKTEARSFANDGCWEVQIPGKTYFGYHPFDGLAILQHNTLKGYTKTDFNSFEELYDAYIADIMAAVEGIYAHKMQHLEQVDGNWVYKNQTPCTVVSLLEEGCIENGLSYLEGGAVYNVYSPHIGGIADVANSLYAIKKFVFEEKNMSFAEFSAIAERDWDGNEILRRRIAKGYEFYGNDNDEIDLLLAKILDNFASCCKALDGRCFIKFPAGVSTFGRQLEWSGVRIAAAHGRRKGEVLAGNMSPTPGTSTKGATAVIKSYCKANLAKQTTGAALDIRLLPNDVKGESGIAAISGLITGFVNLGGFFMQIDVADGNILKEAQKNPEEYLSLAVRISGWNARFVTLSKEWQNMIIADITGE